MGEQTITYCLERVWDNGDMTDCGLPVALNTFDKKGRPSCVRHEFEPLTATVEECDAYLRGEGIIKKCDVCGQDATLTNNFVTHLMKRHSEVAAERDSLRARCNALEVERDKLREGLERIVARTHDIRMRDVARKALAEGESRVPDSEEKNLV